MTRRTKGIALLWAVLIPALCALVHPVLLLTFFLFPLGLTHMVGEYVGKRQMSEDSLEFFSYLFYFVMVAVVLLSTRRVVFTLAYAVLMIAIMFNIVGCYQILESSKSSPITAVPNHALQRTGIGGGVFPVFLPCSAAARR